jgi:hypothetical protein
VSAGATLAAVAAAIIESAREGLAEGRHLYHYKATAADIEYAAEQLGRELTSDDVSDLSREIGYLTDDEPTCECCGCLSPCESWGDGHACDEMTCAHCGDDHDAAYDRARDEGRI